MWLRTHFETDDIIFSLFLFYQIWYFDEEVLN